MSAIKEKVAKMPNWLRLAACALVLGLIVTLVGVGIAEGTNSGTLADGALSVTWDENGT